MSLPFPVHFVYRDADLWSDVFGGADPPDPAAIPDRFRNGRDCWTMQTWLHLRRRGLEVSLARQFVAGAICVVHYDHLYLSDSPHRSFIVAIQPDRPRAPAADLRVVQNHLQILGPADHLIDHWPQPGLLPRDPSRGARLERLVYMGRPEYLAPPFRGEEFRRRLAEMEIEFVVEDRKWFDCRECDAVLAVRDVTDADLAAKPASKLVNAWLAGCPALLGPEPAYRRLRRNETDYIEVRTPTEASAALHLLRTRPALYAAMVANGRRRAEDYTNDRIAGQWVALLAGPAADGYRRWMRGGRTLQPLARWVRHLWRACRHKRERTLFMRAVQK